MADPKDEALRSILGQGPPPPAKTPFRLAGENLQSMGEDFPAFITRGKGGDYTLGAKGEVGGGYSLGGQVTLGQEEKEFELLAQKLGVSPRELRVWLAMRGTQPSSLGASYQGPNLGASITGTLPEGERSVSGDFSYDMGNAGTIGARGTYDIENPRQSSLMGTYTKRF